MSRKDVAVIFITQALGTLLGTSHHAWQRQTGQISARWRWDRTCILESAEKHEFAGSLVRLGLGPLACFGNFLSSVYFFSIKAQSPVRLIEDYLSLGGCAFEKARREGGAGQRPPEPRAQGDRGPPLPGSTAWLGRGARCEAAGAAQHKGIQVYTGSPRHLQKDRSAPPTMRKVGIVITASFHGTGRIVGQGAGRLENAVRRWFAVSSRARAGCVWGRFGRHKGESKRVRVAIGSVRQENFRFDRSRPLPLATTFHLSCVAYDALNALG
ncbi:hypothetical protein FB451DRAFT_1173477 [Mycena latifolia]|nr:hypothetical protein FB451DRAFT_1173477 [Mycena latifolia]